MTARTKPTLSSVREVVKQMLPQILNKDKIKDNSSMSFSEIPDSAFSNEPGMSIRAILSEIIDHLELSVVKKRGFVFVDSTRKTGRPAKVKEENKEKNSNPHICIYCSGPSGPKYDHVCDACVAKTAEELHADRCRIMETGIRIDNVLRDSFLNNSAKALSEAGVPVPKVPASVFDEKPAESEEKWKCVCGLKESKSAFDSGYGRLSCPLCGGDSIDIIA